jgi:hypothetical protein
MSSHKHLNIFGIYTMDELFVLTRKKSLSFTSISGRYASRTMLRYAHKPHSKRTTKRCTDSEILYNPTMANARVAGNGTIHSAALIRDVSAVFMSRSSAPLQARRPLDWAGI